MLDFKIKIGGEAGQGMQTISHTLARVFARGGWHVFSVQDYQSRIRGGHNLSVLRVRESPVFAMTRGINVLIALNKETVDLHKGELQDGGVVIYDGEKIKLDTYPNLLSTPLERFALESGNRLYSNSVAAGAVLGLMGYDFEPLAEVLMDTFGGKNTLAEDNIKAARAGYDYTKKNGSSQFPWKFGPLANKRRMLITGNEALALGALAAGCKFMSAYPMTPSTGVLTYLAGKAKDWGMIVEQAEDEIAAITMAIGASFAGVRAMTATSGGGFCLMVEGLGLAGITETPIVVIEAQRPGPAIGLPTRTEQSDLEFVLHASHGEFPRAVLTPGTPEEAFFAMTKAFNLAEKYQTPTLVISDQHLADSHWTIDNLDISHVMIDRGQLIQSEEREKLVGYKRHAFTDSGISPRALPGYPGITVVTDSDEHDEEGHLTEDTELRTKMMLKRMRKIIGLAQEISPPKLHGSINNPEVLLIGWGSTYGAIREAVDILQSRGQKAAGLHINEIWPFPSSSVAQALESAKACYVIENNATGQLARLIRRETGKTVTEKILKFDGLPFSPEYIVDATTGS